MIQFLIFATTMCPVNISTPCWCKASVVEQVDRFDIVESTYGTECEMKGHDWTWNSISFTYEPGTMYCQRCQLKRNIKKIEHKREVTDIEEVWEDDGSKVERLQQRNNMSPLNNYNEYISTEMPSVPR